MHASKRTVVVDRHEWTLPSPAHHTEVEKAVAVAVREQAQINCGRGGQATDVYISCDDDNIVIGFEARRPEVAMRGTAGEAIDGD